MIPYNTHLKKLVLPEYGRLVHEMVQLCVDIPDREQRNQFAAAIVETMKSMTQEKGKLQDDRKYWDHIYLISERKLDVDSPFGFPEEEAINPVPNKIPFSTSDFGRRHYGNVLQKLVGAVAAMANSEDKDACVELLANHIRKLLVINNEENTSEERVFRDLNDISGGNISVDTGIFDLPEFKEEKPSKTQKRKKNR